METLNAVLAADLPDDPPWQDVQVSDYLAETMPGERRISWVAEDDRLPEGESEIFAHVSVLLLGDIGVLEVMVNPDLRRRGLGRQLVAVAARRAYLEGFSSIGVEAIGGTPAIAVLRGAGLRAGVCGDPQRADPVGGGLAGPGRDGRRHRPGLPGRIPPGWPAGRPAGGYAQAKLEAQDDGDDLDLAPRSSDPQRLRDSLDTLHKRGLKPYIVLAIHEATGEVAGLTEVVVPAQHPERADQYDTIVVAGAPGLRHRPGDQGADAVRAARRRAGAREVQTWNAHTTSRC